MPKPGLKTATSRAVAAQSMIADYYQAFRCIGPECEDSCCIGWTVGIDHATFKRYQACTHPTLQPLFHSVLIPVAEQDRTRARVQMQANGWCPFLQQDKLCLIQKELGADALSDTCAAFPRCHNRFGERSEYALDVSCPEAARMILLRTQPIHMRALEAGCNPGTRSLITLNVEFDACHAPALQSLRDLILRILQRRELSLGARMMLLGQLLDEVERLLKPSPQDNIRHLPPLLADFSAQLEQGMLIEQHFRQLSCNVPRKLQVTTAFLADFLNKAEPRFRECVMACASALLGAGAVAPGEDAGAALLARYQQALDKHYLPYFLDKPHVLENYLVNEVILNLFPFIKGSYAGLYRAMVLNLSIIQFFLVGIAGHDQGLTDARVVQLIQSFARRSAHDNSYISRLSEAVGGSIHPTCADILWMLQAY